MATDSDGMTELWPFMSRIYASPGVASACLRLQETYGLDIPLLLAVLYGAVSDRALDAVAVQALDASCAEWRKTVVHPLRRIRTAMKSGDVMAWSARVPALREAIKAQELMAERIEVEVLEDLIRPLPPASQLCGERTLEDAARLVLDLQAPDRADMLPEDARHICKVLSRLVADHASPRRMKP